MLDTAAYYGGVFGRGDDCTAVVIVLVIFTPLFAAVRIEFGSSSMSCVMVPFAASSCQHVVHHGFKVRYDALDSWNATYQCTSSDLEASEKCSSMLLFGRPQGLNSDFVGV
jgi:hypothetical protein